MNINKKCRYIIYMLERYRLGIMEVQIMEKYSSILGSVGNLYKW